MRYLIGILLFINVGLVAYFIFTFERLFLIMKASSLTDLVKYKQTVNTPPIEKDDFMP